MSTEPCKIIPTTRRVIEGKLLEALEDGSGHVAALLTKEDLDALIYGLEAKEYNAKLEAQITSLLTGLQQLRKEAFKS